LERWKWVVGFEGFYQVSDLGRVRSVDRIVRGGYGKPRKLVGKVLRLKTDKRYGYRAANLHKEGFCTFIEVHRLVMAAWVGPCSEGLEVCHGPNGVADNSVSNLCYGTKSQNSLDRRRDGTDGGRKVVRSDGVEFRSLAIAAEESDCKYQNIWRVCAGKVQTAGGYGWRYRDD
jgi:hypothetical protein